MRESTVIQEWIDLGEKKGYEEGFKKGLKDGLKEGYREGKLECLRELIQRALLIRFETVSPDVLRRINESTNLCELKRWFLQAIKVSKPEELRL